jgi:hypothetical protein
LVLEKESQTKRVREREREKESERERESERHAERERERERVRERESVFEREEEIDPLSQAGNCLSKLSRSQSFLFFLFPNSLYS